MNEVVQVLMSRDGLSMAEAMEELENAKDRVKAGEDPQVVLEEEFGLEPDYIWSIM